MRKEVFDNERHQAMRLKMPRPYFHSSSTHRRASRQNSARPSRRDCDATLPLDTPSV